MTTDFRALCAELLNAIDRFPGWIHPEKRPVIAGARAALADEPVVPEGRQTASVTERPSDEEIMELMPQQMREDLADAVRAMAEQKGIDSTAAKSVMRIMLNRHVVDLTRAVLTRWGNAAPQPPADGEVAELVRLLGSMAAEAELADQVHDASVLDRAADLLQRLSPSQPPAEGEVGKLVQYLHHAAEVDGWDGASPEWCQSMLRAADLLQRLSPPQPVPVSERLPRPKDCDAEGRCWWFALETEVDFGAWTLGTPEACTGDNWGHTHWLPAHALPLPEVES